MNENPPAFPIPNALVEYVLLGPIDDRRQLQDAPVLGDVWLAYAADPAGIQDLLITPHKRATAGAVAGEISAQFAHTGRRGKPVKEARIAYLQGIVAARLYFDEVLRILVPLTQWWREPRIRGRLQDKAAFAPAALRDRIARIFAPKEFRDARSQPSVGQDSYSALDRYIALAGLILWAGQARRPKRARIEPLSVEAVLDAIQPKVGEIADGLVALFRSIKPQPADASEEKVIFQVSLNRRAHAALEKSVPAVKADAARTLFRVACDKITWAVLDSGIDGSHDAFKTADGKSRVSKTLDFTRIRELVSTDNRNIRGGRLELLLKGVKLDARDARKRLNQLAQDAKATRPVNWDVVEELITLDEPPLPPASHGTHVAGIIGADRNGGGKDAGYAGGMCPDIRLYDFRVLAKTLEDTEFAVIAALQYIRYVNERHSYITIHGANLSLAIPHNVRNYACGHTPVCNECERTVDAGVLVVAAAGNRGYQNFETKEGTYEGYAAFSVTDPGNADGVITVGATHGNWPHTYGVSFFSSRGPTGDGRPKPDLVAPGERIQSTLPNNEWGLESGTSMAAPHVSGAAAMLMARYSELIGQPRRLKQILCESATDLGRERSFQGRGMLDVLRAFQSL